ncbi:nucleoside triphosphate hydrolase protein [Wolfiporia cocos MD-104 SS10]|uniref:Nucleoside triphosphate hydrolase protein n=1 Tax=Wolfiporia cocos (strain MD-104) TaxID=742152 RepID=A0A2H3J9V9_WOLCO|nr:nucleoside triphosphate hydrolase protein [Wolfiporia cocos MD-104 SS10]
MRVRPTADESSSGSKRKKRKREQDCVKESSPKKQRKDALAMKPTEISQAEASIPSARKKGTSAAAGTAPTSSSLTQRPIIHAPECVSPVALALSFDQLNVPSKLHPAFEGFKELTPTQASSWPPAIEGRDVVHVARTGSGKTLALCLSALTRLITSPPKDRKRSKGTATVTMLVLAPTHELAVKTHDTLSALGTPHGIANAAPPSGVDEGSRVQTLGREQGREDDADRRRDARADTTIGERWRVVPYLVLDEADRMLDNGMEGDIRSIIGRIWLTLAPLTVNATWSEAIQRVAASFERDAVRVTVRRDVLTANVSVFVNMPLPPVLATSTYNSVVTFRPAELSTTASTTTPSLSIRARKLEGFKWDNSKDLELELPLDEHFYIPNAQSDPLFDAFMVEYNGNAATLWIFQMTVDKNHDGSARGYGLITNVEKIVRGQLHERAKAVSEEAHRVAGQKRRRSAAEGPRKKLKRAQDVKTIYVLVSPDKASEWTMPPGWKGPV